jgi:23S rRNA (guanosine2251-2'-O)-methyltransferase
VEYFATIVSTWIGDQEMKIYGKNPVLERLKADPRSIRVIFVEAGHPEHSYIASKAKKHGIPISVVSGSKMIKLGRSLNTQGLMMEVADFVYADFDDTLEVAQEQGLTFFFLDGITDPQNLGAMIRNLGCLGGFVVVLPTHDAVHITDTVLRVACGGENYVRVCKVSNLNQAIEKARKKGWVIAGSVVKDGQDLRTQALPFPLGLVIGAEDQGIRAVVQQKLDLRLTIPMAHQRMSLNAASAVGMFAYEVARQRRSVRKPKEVVSDAERMRPVQSAVTADRENYDDLPE